MKGFFVTGTDTDVGKTIISLGLCLYFQADYWKPVQTGKNKDSDFIKQFLVSSRVHPSCYEFKAPLSPNQAAQKEKQEIDLKKIKTPKSSFLIVEGIGGVYVPLNKKHSVIDLMLKLQYPVLLTARSGLGTLNHTLMTLSVLKKHQLKVVGVVLSGLPHKQNKQDIEKWGKIPVVLELPLLKSITAKNLKKHFKNLKL